MINFEDLARKKQKQLIIVCVLLVCLVLIVCSHVIRNELLAVGICFVLLIYAVHCLPYSALLSLLNISKKIPEKIQHRTEILQAIAPSEDYNDKVDPILHYPFFLKEQEFQNNVNKILEDSSVSDKDKEDLKQVQKEINELLKIYKIIAKQVLSNYYWWNKYLYRDINPIQCFFTDEDITFFKKTA